MTCPKSQGGFQIDDLWTLKPVVFWWHQNSSSGVPLDSPLDEADALIVPVITWPQLFLILFSSYLFFPHLVLPSLLTFIFPLSPLLWRHFSSLSSWLKISKSHKHCRASPACWNPVSFEFLLTLLFNGHLLSGGSHIFFMPLSNILCIIGYLCCYNFLFLCQAYIWYSILHCWHKRAELSQEVSGLNTFWLCELYEQVILFFNMS